MSSKKKSGKYSSSESDTEMVFTKIKTKYKCGICNKKIKNYCKCVGTHGLPHSGSNIITIMTNPDTDSKLKEPVGITSVKGEKGDKGERGLTGSMGLPGNSIVFFSTGNQVSPDDFVGSGWVHKDFIKSASIIPYEFYVKQIGLTIKTPINSKLTVTMYVNNKPTDFIVCVCDGTCGTKQFNPVNKIKPTDLFCFRVQFEGENLPHGISICVVLN